MPKISKKRKFLSVLDDFIMTSYIYGLAEDEDIENLIEYRVDAARKRYIFPKEPIPRNRSMIAQLWNYPETSFRQETRMSKSSFKILVRMIEYHPIFHNHSQNRQCEIWVQVYITLKRLGSFGNGVSVGQSSRIGGVSAGSVCKFFDRVITAIFEVLHNLIEWPNATERKEISGRFQGKYGLRGAVGIVDGTQIVLSQRPNIDGEVYWTRKHQYAISLQILCDDRKLIRSYVVGWPGSVADSVVFGKSDVYHNPRNYFSAASNGPNDPGEFLLADSGYASESWMCTPYRNPAAQLPVNLIFNELFSSGRVIVEQLIGIFKNRWGSMKGIRNQMITEKDYRFVNVQIILCIILHNLLIVSNDD
jgi:hypothetical protein